MTDRHKCEWGNHAAVAVYSGPYGDDPRWACAAHGEQHDTPETEETEN